MNTTEARSPAREPYYVQAFWSPCKRYLVTACVCSAGREIALVDDDGNQWEPTGPCEDMANL